MKPLFNRIKLTRPGRNLFDLSHERKLSCNMGDLIPIYLQEVVPGDKFRVNTEMLVRLAPMVAPVMHRMNVFTHFFFVPYRLLYQSWEDFITGGVNGLANPDFPKIDVAGIPERFGHGSLADYLGVPTFDTPDFSVGTYDISALPFRAYQLIWEEYYRDQTLQAVTLRSNNDTCDSAEASSILELRKRCWEKDYFTSALPNAQRGGEVLLPMEAEVEYMNISKVLNSADGADVNTDAGLGTLSANPGNLKHSKVNDITGANARIENIESITNSSITINDLRRATRLQEWLERNARGGGRYIEQILAHFGVKSSDARLQRPEYLGGGKQPIVISEVLNTGGDNGAIPQGNMAGHGVSVGKTWQFKKFFEEHGFIMGIMSALPRTTYSQGLPRIFKKYDRFDYYFPEFANIGEQEVRNEELYWNQYDPTQNPNTFGYQSRYAEYKFNNSTVHGDFKGNLSYWHMGRLFNALPGLNAGFVASDPTHRIFAVTDPDEHKLYVQLYNDVKAIRPMPVFGTPTL